MPLNAKGMEQAEDGIMNRAPRPSDESVFANGAGVDMILQGLFIAPHVVAGALEGAELLGQVGQELGFPVCPAPGEARSDIIQAIQLGSEEAMVSFCKGVQSASPVDAFVDPEPWAMPGYDDPVIMAAGAFVQGSSIELSADGPIREPFTVYFQGGLTYDHARFGVLKAFQKMYDDGLLHLPE